MKKILITGGEGFVSSHVIDCFLKNTDWIIYSLDHEYIQNLNKLDYVIKENNAKERVKRIYTKDHKFSSIKEMLLNLEINPIYIFHFAANASVPFSVLNPVLTINQNVSITLEILEYAREIKLNLEKFFHISTEAVFGPLNSEKTLFKEYDRYNSISPYGASKAACEEISVSYSNSYKLPIVILRLMNMIGERARKDQFLPILINKIFNEEKNYTSWKQEKKYFQFKSLFACF
jgi:dTDP-glucose 4,6-dehydratase